MDFNLNVNVKLDATPALVGLASKLASLAGCTVPHAQVLVAGKDPDGPIKPDLAVESPAPYVEPVEAQTGSQEITDEQLRAFVGPKTKEHGKDKIFAILEGLGVKRVPDLNQEQRRVFMDKVNAL